MHIYLLPKAEFVNTNVYMRPFASWATCQKSENKHNKHTCILVLILAIAAGLSDDPAECQPPVTFSFIKFPLGSSPNDATLWLQQQRNCIFTFFFSTVIILIW